MVRSGSESDKCDEKHATGSVGDQRLYRRATSERLIPNRRLVARCSRRASSLNMRYAIRGTHSVCVIPPKAVQGQDDSRMVIAQHQQSMTITPFSPRSGYSLLTKIVLTFGSLLSVSIASFAFWRLAPPPPSRKLAGWRAGRG